MHRYQIYGRNFCFHSSGKGEELTYYFTVGSRECHFYSEDGGNWFLRIFCTYLPDFTASYPSIVSLQMAPPSSQLLPIHGNVIVPCCQIIIIAFTNIFTVLPWIVTGRMRQATLKYEHKGAQIRIEYKPFKAINISLSVIYGHYRCLRVSNN